MSDDFIDEMQAEAQLRFGKELTPSECAEKFMGHDMDARIFHLKRISNDGELSVAEAARRHEITTALKRTHEMLRKAGR